MYTLFQRFIPRNLFKSKNSNDRYAEDPYESLNDYHNKETVEKVVIL